MAYLVPTPGNAVELVRKVRGIVAQAIQAPEEMVTDDLAFGDLPQWDSLGHMEVMMLLEEHFSVEINADTIAALVSIPAICSYIAITQSDNRL